MLNTALYNSRTLETVKMIKDRQLFICIMILKVVSEKYKAQQGKGDLTSILKEKGPVFLEMSNRFFHRKFY